jgi:putative transposase
LYFLGLSYRNTAKALSRFIKRSHVSIWKWIQKYTPEKISYKRRRISEFIVDDKTLIKVIEQIVWLWIATKPTDKTILGIPVYHTKGVCLL